MENGLIFPYSEKCAMEGRRKIGGPTVGCWCKLVGVPHRQIREANPRSESVGASPEAVESPLPRKAPKFSFFEPYRKPTQVGGMNNPRRSRELWPRNSAKYPRNFGRRGASVRERFDISSAWKPQ